jgi:hypothetical protein
MAKYRKKPVIIEAVQFIPGQPLPEGMRRWPNERGIQPRDMSFGYIHTPEGVMHVHSGDWIIKGIKGEFCAVKNDIFEASYELVE